MPKTIKAILRENLERYEERVPHMYLDSNGFVTVGVGHLISSVTEAQKLAFVTAEGTSASGDEIKADFEAVKALTKNRLAKFYKQHTKLTLTNAEINRLRDNHIVSFGVELKRIYSDFDTYPAEVQLALYDMIFNLGMTKLRNNWPKFNAAINAKNWQQAADESNRKAPVSAERNKYVKDLFEKAAKASKKTKKQR